MERRFGWEGFASAESRILVRSPVFVHIKLLLSPLVDFDRMEEIRLITEGVFSGINRRGFDVYEKKLASRLLQLPLQEILERTDTPQS
jgi:hypothetical protein